MKFAINDRLPVVNLAEFVERMSRALPALIALLTSRQLREHPYWGTRFPFHIESFGAGKSAGHCVRPDIVIDEGGNPFVTELDFVASGRGFSLASLPEVNQRRAFLDAFGNWYSNMGLDKVVYGTTIDDPCRPEVELFASALAEHGFNMRSACVDRDHLNGEVVDRLFYWSEVPDREKVRGRNIITAEPFLDSKMVFALIHDPHALGMVMQFLDAESIAFLRTVMPYSEMVQKLREDREATRIRFMGRDGLTGAEKLADLQRAKGERESVVLKNTDIEANDSWGCRGTILGRKYSASKFMAALLDGAPLPGKGQGQNPILQQFHMSADFAQLWNEVVNGNIVRADPAQLDRPLAEVTRTQATSRVYARAGVYFLVNNQKLEVTHAPYGVLTLRQDALAHGSSDAIITAFQIG